MMASLTPSEITTVKELACAHRTDARVFQTPDGVRHIRWPDEAPPEPSILIYVATWRG